MWLNSQQLRLLPWSDPTGRPCYLRSSTGTGYVSRLADRVEAEQLDTASEFIAYAAELLNDDDPQQEDLVYLAGGLTDSLRNALRIAESRGNRLTPADAELQLGEADGPKDTRATHDADDEHSGLGAVSSRRPS
ncbi:hypothetical protein SRB5_40320 [Streptomyces sp. RB5]|uniref:Uncharacterized protein n=1 Tax=Streptomyces smaragdinus TaxID=2585196 RepID=A0A7K0CK80_9ACTN|nr:hypothetical protein [Streptomyces smaragdinus]MQY13876.1 hypothetical protein [Streptomyces smaragdinus]